MMGEILSFGHLPVTKDSTRKIKMKSMFLIMFGLYLSWYTSEYVGGGNQNETYQNFKFMSFNLPY